MTSLMAQAAAEAAKAPGIFSGQFVVNTAMVIAALKVVEAGFNAWKRKRARTEAQRLELVSPPPKPGESETCKDHLEQIKELKGKVEDQGHKLAGLAEFKANTAAGMVRIERKIDDLKDLIIGKERT